MRILVLAVLLLGGASLAQSPVARADAPPRPGFVFFAGRWRLPEEIRYLQRAAGLRSAAAADASTQAAPKAPKADTKVAAAAAVAARAPAGAAASERATATPGTRLGGGEVRRRPGPAVRAPRTVRGRTTALLSIEAQHVELLGFDTVTVGVGNGSVRLMLPRTQSISIGTSVVVPVR